MTVGRKHNGYFQTEAKISRKQRYDLSIWTSKTFLEIQEAKVEKIRYIMQQCIWSRESRSEFLLTGCPVLFQSEPSPQLALPSARYLSPIEERRMHWAYSYVVIIKKGTRQWHFRPLRRFKDFDDVASPVRQIATQTLSSVSCSYGKMCSTLKVF